MSDINRLAELMTTAHFDSAMKNEQNLSSSIIRQMAVVGKTFPEAAVSAILTLGGKHAPVTQAREVLFYTTDEDIAAAVKDGALIPGFGNAFHKDSIDPSWEEFDRFIKEDAEAYADRIEEVAGIIHESRGPDTQKLFPNPAAYTAVVADVLNMPIGTELSLIINARMRAWVIQWDAALSK